jgi:PKD repeat protein
MKTKLLLTGSLLLLYIAIKAQNSWSSKTNFGGSARTGAAGFFIATTNKAYIGTGYNNAGAQLKDFWEYDVSTNVWQQRTDFPGMGREGAVGFSIGTKGYIGTGQGIGGTCYQDFLEYNPATNSWASKTPFPGGVRAYAVGFSIGNKGYIGTGYDDNSNKKNDFYEYDTTNNSWTQKTNFTGTARAYAVGFSIGTKGYIGTGEYANGYSATKNDFWEYNPAGPGSWAPKANFPGSARLGATGFSIGSFGYIGTGMDGNTTFYNDFWEYNQNADSWLPKTNYVVPCSSAVSFSSCTKGYIGTGSFGSNSFSQNFAEYIPSKTPMADFTASQATFCVGTCINFTDASTNAPTSWVWTFPGGTPTSSSVQNPTNICFNTAGTYTVSLTASDERCSFTATKTIVVNPLPIVNANSNSPVCTNTKLNLTANGGITYSWQGPGFTSTSQNPQRANANNNMAGTYSVTATDINGCVASSVTSVVVNPLPTITTGSTNTICKGDSIIISASGGVSYSWAPIGKTGASITVKPTANTTYTVTGTDANGCSNTASASIVVKPLPALSLSSNSPLCVNLTLRLSANLVSSASYNWTGPNNFSSQTQNPSVFNSTVADSGWYHCTIIGSNGCSKTDSLIAIVSQTPYAFITANKSNVICSGDSIVLTATPGSSYLWNTNATTQSIKVTTGGNFSCFVNSPNGCPNGNATTPTYTTAINPSPSTPAITQTGNTLASSISGTSYQWYLNGILQTQYTTQFITITSMENGSWWVIVTNSFNCSATSPWFTPSALGIGELSNNSTFKIYPNPTNGIFNLQISQTENIEIKICDVYGKNIYQNNNAASTIQIDLSSQASGVYFISIQTKGGVVTKKILVTH